MKQIIGGSLLFLASIWGGAYFGSLYPFGHWANFPIYLTASAVGLFGVALVIAEVS